MMVTILMILVMMNNSEDTDDDDNSDDSDSDYDDNSKGAVDDHLAQDMETDSGRMEVVGVARIVASLVPGREAINSNLRTKSDVLGF